ncbi:MAG: helix-turn-helix transcriptional regulator [Sphingobacteriaceae bacterium]|jgi:DNA-binding XRE family transcriptional regulator|nr:helix-turn-helix transcriptional regulator [Sphingobacteriaceae bacterium]
MKTELGHVIAACRKACSYKQDYMAYRLGITTHAYANMERGRCDISSSKLKAIADIFLLKPFQLIVLAEEIIEVGHDEWLYSVIRGMLRLTSPQQSFSSPSAEDLFLQTIEKSLTKAVSHP